MTAEAPGSRMASKPARYQEHGQAIKAGSRGSHTSAPTGTAGPGTRPITWTSAARNGPPAPSPERRTPTTPGKMPKPALGRASKVIPGAVGRHSRPTSWTNSCRITCSSPASAATTGADPQAPNSVLRPDEDARHHAQACPRVGYRHEGQGRVSTQPPGAGFPSAKKTPARSLWQCPTWNTAQNR